MIEVCNCGEGHRTWLRESTCVYWVPLASVYKGGRRRRPAKGKVRPRRGVLLPLGVGLLPFLVQQGKGEGEKKEGGGRPLAPNQFGLGLGGRAPTAPLLPPFSTKAHECPLTPRGVPVTPQYSVIYPVTPETIPVSEYNLPIYQSLCLDHFETPRHVRDLIRDSEKSSVHQNT